MFKIWKATNFTFEVADLLPAPLLFLIFLKYLFTFSDVCTAVFHNLIRAHEAVKFVQQVESEILEAFNDDAVLELEKIMLRLSGTVVKEKHTPASQPLTHGTFYALAWPTTFDSKPVIFIRYFCVFILSKCQVLDAYFPNSQV